MTRETLEKLPANVRDHIESIRKDYKNNGLRKDDTRMHAYGYTLGLRDGGLITERQRQILYVYCTV